MNFAQFILNYFLGRDERDRAMLADQAVRKFHDQINGPIGKSLTKKQLVESMVRINLIY